MLALKISLALTVSLCVVGCGSEPTDTKLIQNFQDHRAQFEALHAMIVHDQGLLRVDDDWTDPADPATVGVLPQRIAEYRGVFRQLDVPRGFYSLPRGSIELIAYSQDMMFAGSSKGYCWLASPPFIVVPDIDDLQVRSRAGKAKSWEDYHDAYRHLEGNWYLHRRGD